MNRLNLVTLGVKNLIASIEFYREILGFEVIVYGEESAPNVAFFNNHGTKISLFPLDELVKDIREESPPLVTSGFSGITLAYNAKSELEVDAIFNHLQQHNVPIAKLPQRVSWGGYSGYFQDLDGYYWEVAYGDMWEFDEQDMLVIKP